MKDNPMSKPKHKTIIVHKDTGKFVGRNAAQYTSYFDQRFPNRYFHYLIDDMQDCRVLTNKSAAANCFLYQKHKDEFDLVPVKLVAF